MALRQNAHTVRIVEMGGGIWIPSNEVPGIHLGARIFFHWVDHNY